MLFPSEVFLFVFFPIVLVVYYALLRKTRTLKNIFLSNCKSLFLCMGRTHICLSDDCNDFSQLDVWYICGRVSG